MLHINNRHGPVPRGKGIIAMRIDEVEICLISGNPILPIRLIILEHMGSFRGLHVDKRHGFNTQRENAWERNPVRCTGRARASHDIIPS